MLKLFLKKTVILTDNGIYLTWQDLGINMKDYKDLVVHLQKLQDLYMSEKNKYVEKLGVSDLSDYSSYENW